jgi:hypothetical protein
MVHEKEREMREKYLKESPCWILGIINRELNLCAFKGNEGSDELNDHHDMTLAYWR